jgi:AraC-like DNA-binding protein
MGKNGRYSAPGSGLLTPDVMVSFIYQDKDDSDIYWIATKGNGLIRLKGDKAVFAFTLAAGLFSNTIYQVFEDSSGYLWMSCDKGIFKALKKELNDLASGAAKIQKIDYTYYGKSDGMKSEECSRWGQYSSIKTSDGKLLFGTTKGISVIDPQNLKINTIPPPVMIEKVVSNNRDLELEKETGRLILRSLDYIQFSFATSTLISSDRVSFKYKLENYEDGWTMVTPSQVKMATYRDLRPGRYTFQVMAANSDGIWNETGASFSFEYSPGFIRSLLFKIILGTLLITAGSLFYFLGKKYLNYRRAKNKYKDSLLDPEIVEQCMKKLSYVMDIEKLYRDDKLSLQVLSKKVSVTPHILSQVLNERMDKNFSDFVNGFRIEEAKKMLQEADEDTSVLRVCYEVGFNSKSAFYRAFKKNTDKTPSQYQKELKEKK